jgi:hypothetical protein
VFAPAKLLKSAASRPIALLELRSRFVGCGAMHQQHLLVVEQRAARVRSVSQQSLAVFVQPSRRLPASLQQQLTGNQHSMGALHKKCRPKQGFDFKLSRFISIT